MVNKIKMEKEKTPVERLHDDIRRAVDKIEDDMDDIVRIHCHENDDAG
jgi:cytosine/adenosine deaminase-related metal-dependent hydrolase|tara:strand:- start:226 stop:369 length:144 start_codon:yes stop_codon:yes gene_type:complete